VGKQERREQLGFRGFKASKVWQARRVLQASVERKVTQATQVRRDYKEPRVRQVRKVFKAYRARRAKLAR
jgi:hypothetical protein